MCFDWVHNVHSTQLLSCKSLNINKIYQFSGADVFSLNASLPVVTEIWPNDSVPDNQSSTPSFFVIFGDRATESSSETRVGVVCLWFRSHMSVYKVPEINDLALEVPYIQIDSRLLFFMFCVLRIRSR